MGAFWLNFRPLQEIEAIMGGWRIIDTRPFFVRLQYVLLLFLQCGALCHVRLTVLCFFFFSDICTLHHSTTYTYFASTFPVFPHVDLGIRIVIWYPSSNKGFIKKCSF